MLAEKPISRLGSINLSTPESASALADKPIMGDAAMMRVRLKADGRIVESLPDGNAKTIDHSDPAVFVRRVRARTKLSQVEFAARIGVPVETVRNWEQGKRSPRGPARALLKVIDKAPELAFDRTGSIAPTDDFESSALRPRKLRLGPDGQLRIPTNFREALGLKEGNALVAFVEDGEIHLLTMAATARRAQASVRRFVPEGVSLVDEILEDRRREVEDEEKNG